jgi:hypothetical protein
MELTYRGTDNFEVFATVKPELGGRIVELSHRERQGAEPIVTYIVRAVPTPQPFGGVRWWFICPATNRRVTKLWLPLGGSRFASRPAYRLGYGVQRESRLDRLDRRAARIYRTLAGPTEWRNGIPPKPRYMRWPTYSRRALALRSAIAAYDAAWAGGVFRRFPMIQR